MSSQELKFYKCKLCKEVELVAGKYCIDCAKKNKYYEVSKRHPLNSKPTTIGYPFIQQDECITYGSQTFTGTTASTDLPIWTNFTASGNATTATPGSIATFTSGTAMDLGSVAYQDNRQKYIPKKRKISRHK